MPSNTVENFRHSMNAGGERLTCNCLRKKFAIGCGSKAIFELSHLGSI